MQTVSAHEFNANQKKYFALAEQEPVWVTRSDGRPICLSATDDMLSAYEIAAILQGIADIKSGNTTRIRDIQSIWDDIL